MKITDYKYDKETFRENALKALQEKELADKVLRAVEENQRKRGYIALDYYKAYLTYMTTDNAHMKTCLDYLKYYYETMTFYSIEKESSLYFDFAKQAKIYFDEYYQVYVALKTAELDFKAALEKVEQNGGKIKSMPVLYELHSNLVKNDETHLSMHTQAEMLREKNILPLFARCDKLIPELGTLSEEEPNA